MTTTNFTDADAMLRVTMGSADWSGQTIGSRVLADVEDTCQIEQRDVTTFEIRIMSRLPGALARVKAALDEHPAVVAYEHPAVVAYEELARNRG